MKKLIGFFLILVLLLSLTACGSGTKQSSGTPSTVNSRIAG